MNFYSLSNKFKLKILLHLFSQPKHMISFSMLFIVNILLEVRDSTLKWKFCLTFVMDS